MGFCFQAVPVCMSVCDHTLTIFEHDILKHICKFLQIYSSGEVLEKDELNRFLGQMVKGHNEIKYRKNHSFKSASFWST